MKKLLILSFVAASAVSSMANATQVCSGATAAANGTAVNPASPTAEFVKVAFTPKCSANTLVNYTENATAFGVAAGSLKGKNVFSGGTSGGGVKAVAACPTSGCTATEVTDAVATTARDAS